jgi:hypothetical protein
MATLAPIIVRNVKGIVNALKKVTPTKLSFGATLLHKTLKNRMFSVGGPFIREEKRLLILFGAYAGALFGVILIRNIGLFVLFILIGIFVIYLLKDAIDAYMSPVIDMDNFRDMHLLVKDEKGIHEFIIGTMVKIVSAPFIVSILWGAAQIGAGYTDYYVWWIAIAGVLLIIGSIAMGNERIYDATMVRPVRLRKDQMVKGFTSSWDKTEKKGRRGMSYGRRKKERATGKFRPMRYDELISKGSLKEETSKGSKKGFGLGKSK